MARQTLAKTISPNGFPSAGLLLTETAEDATNHSQFSNTGKEILVIHNTHASTGYTYTIYSVADESGRTGDITAQAIAATLVHIIGPFSLRPGWNQTTGLINVDANNASVKFAVIVIP